MDNLLYPAIALSMGEDAGLSLWLVPAKDVSQRLTKIMHIRPEQSTCTSSYPRFDPHITLGTSPDLDALRSAIPANQRRVPVRFKSVDVGPTYTRSVLVAVHPDTEISMLERHIRAKLGKGEPPPSFPHMSFFYIDDAEKEERQRVVGELEEKGIIQSTADGVVLRCEPEGRAEDQTELAGFDGCEIWIVQCEGKVEEDWNVLEKISLAE